jgi:mono/diheme cytochrome c family protein
MANQPKYKPLQESDFFHDGRSARPLQPGTVARGQLRDDDLLGADDAERAVSLVGLAGGPLAAAVLAPTLHPEATDFPVEITQKELEQGRERFNIYCAVCHDRTGSGHGKVVERGNLRPPSYHTDRLRNMPVGHYFNVITNGWGGMPDYKEQIPPRDRWCIVAYVRALPFSQNVPAKDLTPEEREALDKAEGAK